MGVQLFKYTNLEQFLQSPWQNQLRRTCFQCRSRAETSLLCIFSQQLPESHPWKCRLWINLVDREDLETENVPGYGLRFTFNSWAEGLGASAAAAASGSVDLFNDMLALPSVIATIITRPTSPLFSAFSPTLTAYADLS